MEWIAILTDRKKQTPTKSAKENTNNSLNSGGCRSTMIAPWLECCVIGNFDLFFYDKNTK